MDFFGLKNRCSFLVFKLDWNKTLVFEELDFGLFFGLAEFCLETWIKTGSLDAWIKDTNMHFQMPRNSCRIRLFLMSFHFKQQRRNT